MTQIVIIGGGPAGYEAALVAARLGAAITLVERDGAGGSCVLYDCVPSKTFIVSANAATTFRDGDSFGVLACEPEEVQLNVPAINGRVHGLALAQSTDIHTALAAAGVTVVAGTARLASGSGPHAQRVAIEPTSGDPLTIDADVVLIATGASPRQLPRAVPDGARILTWRQLYDLDVVPPRLVIVGSGVTGAEFASAYQAMGSAVTLISSRDRVMPHEDSDAASLIERVFAKRGMELLFNARAEAVHRTDDGIEVELADGRRVAGSHALLTVGSVPNTADLGLAEAGVACGGGGHITVDRVSRTSVPGVYAAGDCTGVLPLASVAAEQGRLAMWHALGEAVQPLDLTMVAANVFTDPEIATVGIGQKTVDSGAVEARSVMMPLATNARAKMTGMHEGFVKLFCTPGAGIVVGGVVVAPRASEIILAIAMAVECGLTVRQVAQTVAIYPSLSGSVIEAARRLIAF